MSGYPVWDPIPIAGVGTITTKDHLHHLVDELPEGQPTQAAERVLTHLVNLGEDPVVRALINAPDDDEPLTDDERAAIAEGLADLERGDVVSDEELRRELGL
jgi:hypothetical protein